MGRRPGRRSPLLRARAGLACACVRMHAWMCTYRPSARHSRSRAHERTPRDNTVTSHTRLMLFLCRRRRRPRRRRGRRGGGWRRWRWRRRCWHNDVTLLAPYARVYTPTRAVRAKSLILLSRALLKPEVSCSGIRTAKMIVSYYTWEKTLFVPIKHNIRSVLEFVN